MAWGFSKLEDNSEINKYFQGPLMSKAEWERTPSLPPLPTSQIRTLQEAKYLVHSTPTPAPTTRYLGFKPRSRDPQLAPRSVALGTY